MSRGVLGNIATGLVRRRPVSLPVPLPVSLPANLPTFLSLAVRIMLHALPRPLELLPHSSSMSTSSWSVWRHRRSLEAHHPVVSAAVLLSLRSRLLVPLHQPPLALFHQRGDDCFLCSPVSLRCCALALAPAASSAAGPFADFPCCVM